MLKTYVIEFCLENGLKSKVRYNARDVYSINKWIELNRYKLINIKEHEKYEKCNFMISVYGEVYELFNNHNEMFEHLQSIPEKTRLKFKGQFYNTAVYDEATKETYLFNGRL